jgi:hypothetical protein
MHRLCWLLDPKIEKKGLLSIQILNSPTFISFIKPFECVKGTIYFRHLFVHIMLNKIKLVIVVKETKMSAVRRHSIQGYMTTTTKRKTNRE